MVSTFCAHIFANKWLVFWSRILRLNLLTFLGKLYVLPIESAFEIFAISITTDPSNGFSHFCAHILNSHIAWHSRKITVA